jgi:hypothetical protein
MTMQPHEIIDEERTPLYLASAFSPAEAASECGYLLDEVNIRWEWYRPRPLTDKEIADENVQATMNPDWDIDEAPATVEYLPCSPDHPEAACYLRVTEEEEMQ